VRKTKQLLVVLLCSQYFRTSAINQIDAVAKVPDSGATLQQNPSAMYLDCELYSISSNTTNL
jgi:hypothetical protein